WGLPPKGRYEMPVEIVLGRVVYDPTGYKPEPISKPSESERAVVSIQGLQPCAIVALVVKWPDYGDINLSYKIHPVLSLEHAIAQAQKKIAEFAVELQRAANKPLI